MKAATLCSLHYKARYSPNLGYRRVRCAARAPLRRVPCICAASRAANGAVVGQRAGLAPERSAGCAGRRAPFEARPAASTGCVASARSGAGDAPQRRSAASTWTAATISGAWRGEALLLPEAQNSRRRQQTTPGPVCTCMTSRVRVCAHKVTRARWRHAARHAATVRAPLVGGVVLGQGDALLLPLIAALRRRPRPATGTTCVAVTCLVRSGSGGVGSAMLAPSICKRRPARLPPTRPHRPVL